jgi:gamma-glutamyl-gamma-aminobutyrate hydrolase PuuD
MLLDERKTKDGNEKINDLFGFIKKSSVPRFKKIINRNHESFTDSYIGISFRTDGKGTAHEENDKAPFIKLNDILENKGKIKPIELPNGAKGEKVPKRKFDKNQLDRISGLYIPGSRTASDSQTKSLKSENCDDENFKVSDKDPQFKGKSFITEEHHSRADYEQKLIGKARNMGMPILAVCAGIWRLIESYGGKTETLPKEIQKIHFGEDTVWGIHHNLKLIPGSNICTSAVKIGLFEEKSKFEIQGINTTHWAVVSKNDDGTLVKSDNFKTNPNSEDPNDILQISAYSDGKDTFNFNESTVECIESKYGAPVFGFQWHPEKEIIDYDGRNKTITFKLSLKIFKDFIDATKTYENKKQLMQELKDIFKMNRKAK